MLIAFVLLGRNLEQRAKIKATSDMTGLLSSLPSQARLMVDGSIVEVPCSSLSVGDQIVVLPGVSKLDSCFILLASRILVLSCVVCLMFTVYNFVIHVHYLLLLLAKSVVPS